MASIGKIVGTIEAQSDAFSKGTRQAGSDLDEFRKKIQATKSEASGLRGVLDSLKSGAGRGSTLDETLKTLNGGFAAAGITLLGEGLRKATGDAQKLNEEFRKGNVDASGLAVGIGKSIPIFGGFIEAGQNIREIITHEKEAIDDVNKTTQITNELTEARVKLIHDARNAIREYGKEAAGANAKVIESTLPPGQRKAYEIDFQFSEKQDDLKHKVEEQLKGVDDAVKSQRDKMASDLLGLQNELGHDKEGTDKYKKLKTNIDQITGSVKALTETAKEQKRQIQSAADGLSKSIAGEQKVAERAPVIDYLESMKKKLDELNPSPVNRVTVEIENLGGKAGDTQKALELLAKTEAASAYKKNADGLTEWGKALDETEAKIKALQSGADEHVAEQWSKLHTDDDGQRDTFAAFAKRQLAEDTALKTIEQQKRVTEEITALQKEAAQVGMSEAQKKLDDLKRDGANSSQIKQAEALQKQADAAVKGSELFKTSQEEAKRLIESSLTPLDKFGDEVTKINTLFAEGLLTAAQASAALDKEGKELAKANKDENKHAGADTRRFDFNLPRAPAHRDEAKEAIATAKRTLQATEAMRYFLEQLYNFGQANQQTADLVYNF